MSPNAEWPKLSVLWGRSPSSSDLEAELAALRALGFARVAWTLDHAGSRDNPLVTERGRARLAAAASRTGTSISSVIADYFASRPLIGDTARASALVLERTVGWAAALGAERVVVRIPGEVVLRPEIAVELATHLLRALGLGAELGVGLALAADAPASALVELVQRVDHPALGLAYHTGLAAERGRAVAAEVEALGQELTMLLLGDAEMGDGPRSLGHGRASLPQVLGRVARARPACDLVIAPPAGDDARFEALRALNYVRLMCARGALGDAA